MRRPRRSESRSSYRVPPPVQCQLSDVPDGIARPPWSAGASTSARLSRAFKEQIRDRRSGRAQNAQRKTPSPGAGLWPAARGRTVLASVLGGGVTAQLIARVPVHTAVIG